MDWICLTEKAPTYKAINYKCNARNLNLISETKEKSGIANMPVYNKNNYATRSYSNGLEKSK